MIAAEIGRMSVVEAWTAGPKAPWLEVSYGRNREPVLMCHRCSTSEPIDRPISLEGFARQAKAFVESHFRCKLRNPDRQAALA